MLKSQQNANQETRSLGLRPSYTATPTLSLQLSAAPFLSRGRYSDIREKSATPRAARCKDRCAFLVKLAWWVGE